VKFNVTFLERTASTNTHAWQLIHEGMAGEGTVIWAGEQYAGRGQGENTWLSQPGMNLTFSLVLEPSALQPDRQFCLNKAVALAVLSTVRELAGNMRVSIKWPNDIYIGGKKAAGILIEHSIQGNLIRHSVIGIGINLNQLEFPSGLPNPVSLKQLTGLGYNPKDVLEMTCSRLSAEYYRLEEGYFNMIHADYDKSLAGLGLDMEFAAGPSTVSGRITGVDELGRLLVLTADGLSEKFNHGEISYVIRES